MADTYPKYKLVRQVSGKLNLSDPLHEAVVHLLASKTSDADICQFLKVTPEQIKTILDDPLAQRRLAYKQRLISNPEKTPETPAECLKFAKRHFGKIIKKAKQHKDRATACKTLASIAIEQQKSAPIEPAAKTNDETLAKLAAAFSVKNDDSTN